MFTDSADLLSQIQKFQENYQCVLSNGHSTITEDLVVFMFCSTLPDSYQDTACQYLNNINDITKYKLQPIIDWVIQEESRRKAQNATTSGSLSTIHKFSTIKKYEKHCAKCGRNNHSAKDHRDTPPQRQGGRSGSGGGLKKKEGSHVCQTRIGIGVTLAYKSLSYRSDSRVRGDCDRRPVPVCEGLIVSISEV